MNRQDNNELAPELLATMDQSPFTAEQLAEMDEGIALAGSLLENGDKINGAPQDGSVLTGREGVAMPPDSLAAAGDA